MRERVYVCGGGGEEETRILATTFALMNHYRPFQEPREENDIQMVICIALTVKSRRTHPPELITVFNDVAEQTEPNQ